MNLLEWFSNYSSLNKNPYEEFDAIYEAKTISDLEKEVFLFVNEWQSKASKVSKSNLFNYLEHFNYYFAYNSSKIENEEINFALIQCIYEGCNSRLYPIVHITTVLDAINQVDATDYIHSCFDSSVPITEEFLLKLHYTLTKSTYRFLGLNSHIKPGAYRNHNVRITNTDTVLATYEDVPKLIKILLEDMCIHQHRDIFELLHKAAEFHCRFEKIHPFSDGNGRTGRSLLNYWFLLNNIPPIIIIYEDRKQYYHALQQYDHKETTEGMYSFLLFQMLKTWKRILITFT